MDEKETSPAQPIEKENHTEQIYPAWTIPAWMRDSAWLFNSKIPEEALKIGENLGLGMSAFLIPHSATGSFAEAVVRINELKEGGPEAARLRQEIAEKEAALAKQNSELVKRSEALLKAQQEKSASDAEGLQLKSKIDSLTAEFKTQEREIASLQKQKDLRYLISRVCPAAAEKLLHDPRFVERFEKAKTCNSFILAIDIRRSTDLMLRGRTPQLYASFLNLVCGELLTVVKENYGVVDKFTGDGLLAYFPDFFSGKDAGYRALAAAHACHSIFNRCYKASRTSFNVTLKDVGLGIGIDFGEVHLLRITEELTVVGSPVVYASRLSGAPAGRTYMNHSAVASLVDRSPEAFTANEVDFEVKHEGTVVCQDVSLSHLRYEPESPDWLAKFDRGE